MSVLALFLAAVMAVIAWWLVQQRITTKPWLETGPIGDAGAPSLPAAKIGLGVFLAVAGTLFALFFSAFMMRMNMPELNAPEWKPVPAPAILWFNTGLLVFSSGALQWARAAARRRRVEGVKAGLVVGAGFALAFLAGQLIAWQQLNAAGYYLTANPAAAFFYLITGIHGVHLLGGLAALGAAAEKAWQGITAKEIQLRIELCAIYWHFLLLVWLVFFGLLLFTDPSRPGSGLISFICGML